MEVVASLSQGRTAAAQCGLFTHKSVPVVFEPPYTKQHTAKFRTYKACLCNLSIAGYKGFNDLRTKSTAGTSSAAKPRIGTDTDDTNVK